MTQTPDPPDRLDPHDFTRIDATARRMIARYSTMKIAEEMANWHGCDYPPASRERNYWTRVGARIMQYRLSRGE